MGNTASAMQDRAARKRHERDTTHAASAAKVEVAVAAVPPELQSRIMAATATALSEMMASGACTSEQILLTLSHRCATVGMSLGGVTEERYLEAIAAARESDARRARGAALGPLDGIPISIKDHILQRGTDSTAGLACKTFKPAQEDGLLVASLRGCGAIPFVRSNVPQALLVPESANYIWGAAVNPWSGARTSGGSSGGEGTLIASRCSPLGIGTDIGGSIRIPSHFCGIFGLKPTPARFVHGGIIAPRENDVDGQQSINPTAGPLARCVDDLALIMRAMLRPEVWAAEPTLPMQPFDEAVYSSTTPLRIGVFPDDGFFEPAPPCKRAVREAADALRAAGHTVVDFSTAGGMDTYRLAIIFYAILSADGNLALFREALEGEALHPMYHSLSSIASVPAWLRPAIAALLRSQGKTRMADMFVNTAGKGVYEMWKLVAERNMMATAFFEAWRAAGLDLILLPGLGLPALPHGGSRELTPACSYAFICNTLHMPAGTVPVTRVRKEEQYYECPQSQRDQFGEAAFPAMDGTAGLPVGVQLAGLPFRDELVLRGMKALEAALHGTRAAASSAVSAAEVALTEKDGDVWVPSEGAPETVIQQTLRDVAAHPCYREGRLE